MALRSRILNEIALPNSFAYFGPRAFEMADQIHLLGSVFLIAEKPVRNGLKSGSHGDNLIKKL